MRKTAELTNRTDPDEGAHYEPPHQNLFLFVVCSLNSQYDTTGKSFAVVNFVVCLLALKKLRKSTNSKEPKMAIIIADLQTA